MIVKSMISQVGNFVVNTKSFDTPMQNYGDVWEVYVCHRKENSRKVMGYYDSWDDAIKMHNKIESLIRKGVYTNA